MELFILVIGAFVLLQLILYIISHWKDIMFNHFKDLG